MDVNRREFLKQVIYYGTVSGVTGNTAYDVLKNLFSFVTADGSTTTILQKIINPINTTNTLIFRRYLDIGNVIQVYPGEGNILAVLDEKKGLSPYINFACNNFAGFFPKRKDYVKVLSGHPSLQLNNEQDILHLGGPVANILAGKATGYTYKLLENDKPFPAFRETTRLRWAFDVGQQDFGDRGQALRCEDGETKPRPRYALIDTCKADRLIFQDLDENERALEDWLLITKVPNYESKSQKNILSIGGMHGHSLEAFASNLDKHFYEIASRVKFADSEYFQLLLPCKLSHTTEMTGVQRTQAQILWNQVDYQPLS